MTTVLMPEEEGPYPIKAAVLVGYNVVGFFASRDGETTVVSFSDSAGKEKGKFFVH